MPKKTKPTPQASLLRDLSKIGDVWEPSDPKLGDVLAGASSDVLCDSDFFKRAVRIVPASLYYADESVRSNKPIVSLFLSDQTWSNKHASPALGHWFAAWFAKSSLSDDHELIVGIMRRWALRCVSSPSGNREDKTHDGFEKILPASRDFWIKVAQDRTALDYAEVIPDTLKNDRELNLLFFLKDPPSIFKNHDKELQSAKERIVSLLKDDEFVHAALIRDPGLVDLSTYEKSNRDAVDGIFLSAKQVFRLLSALENSSFQVPLEKIERADYSLTYRSSFFSFVKRAVSVHSSDSELITRSIGLLLGKFAVAPIKLRDVFQSVSPQLLGDKKFCLTLCGIDGLLLQFVGDLCNDTDVVMAAVSQNGLALKFASEALKDNEAIVKCALTQNGNSLDDASPRLKFETLLTELALEHGLWFRANLQGLPQSFLTKENVIDVLSRNGGSLNGLPKDLCCDREVLIAALSSWRGAGELPTTSFISQSYHLCCDLLDDKDVVMSALAVAARKLAQFTGSLAFERNPYAYASDRLRNDREVLLAAVGVDGNSLSYAPEAFRDDKEVVLKALSSTGQFHPGETPLTPVYRLASARLKEDKDVTLTALRHADSKFCFDDVPTEFWGDKDAVLAALDSKAKPSEFWKLVKTKAKDDPDVALAKILAG